MPVKPRPTPSELLARMTKREREGVRELERRLKAAQREVAEKIRAAAERRRIAADAGARDRVYGEIESVYERLAEDIDSWTRDLVGDVAREWHREAIDEVPRNRRNADLLRFDRERVERYWSIVRPGNDKHLAAVFTDSLTASSKRMLRSAFVDTFRQSAVSGWTANETQKRLQQRWDSLAGNLAGDRFVDAGGRVWTNARYLQMLIRTTQQRVSTESFMDTMAQGGFQLARISDDGDPCPVCRAWAGVVVDIVNSGKTKYPNLKDAYDSGWKHPNCGCRLEYMDEAVDADELERQADRQTPARPEDLRDAETRRAYIEKVQAYSDTIRIDEKRAAGMTVKEAETDLKRDKLKISMRAAFPVDGEDRAGWIDDIPDPILEQIDMNKLPRIEAAKKGEKPNSSRSGELGGVLHLDRGATPGQAKRALYELEAKRGVRIADWRGLPPATDQDTAIGHFALFKDTVTPDEKAAILKYTRKKLGVFGTLNEALRDGMGETLPPEMQKTIADLNQLLERAPKFHGATYRGLGFSADTDKGRQGWSYFSGLKKGQKHIEKAFVSSSFDELPASEFATEDRKVFIRIVRGRSGVPLFDFSDATQEKEVLFPTDRTFKVLNVIPDRGKLVVEVEEI